MNPVTTEPRYRVCNGELLVNDERVPVHRRILKIGLIAAGVAADACRPLSERAARRILHLERSLLISRLADELRRVPGADQAA